MDARILLNREQIDAANTPVIFVELVTGQNGTLTPYPGQGFDKHGLEQTAPPLRLSECLKASRGMGDDVMGSSSLMPSWSKIITNKTSYERKISHLSGNNKLSERAFQCNIHKSNNQELLEIWEVNFSVTKFEEVCENNSQLIKIRIM